MAQLTREKAGIKIQGFSPNPNKTFQIDFTGGETVDLLSLYPEDISYYIFSTKNISISFNDNEIYFPVLPNVGFGIILNKNITQIRVKDLSTVAHTVNIMVM